MYISSQNSTDGSNVLSVTFEPENHILVSLWHVNKFCKVRDTVYCTYSSMSSIEASS